ncbi:proline dehydrogenase [Parafrankia sp. FMc2]|uniref:proline dehydrogenase n=1 Tax=Parafrankia sp. FMc2 TaxID=3233196 RepID=UPI0034D75D42
MVAGGMLGRLGLGAGPIDALTRAARVADARVLATIDRMGEPAADVPAAEAATGSYLTLLDLADRAGIAEDLDLSLRLPTVGQQMPRNGGKIAYENAAEICARAAALGATVTLAAPGSAAVDAALATLAELRRDVPTTGVTLCATLARTPADCRDLARSGARVRLRSGAPGGAGGRQYAVCVGILMAGSGYPMIATRDPRLLALTTRLAVHVGRRRDSFELQTVRGTPGRLHRRLAADGYRTRIRAAYGPVPPGRG